MRAFLAQTRKAIGTAAVLLGAWGTAVLHSKAGGVTTDEWAALIPIGVAVLACYGLTNDPRPLPEPVEVHEDLEPAAGMADG